MVFGGARDPSKMRITVDSKGFLRFLTVFDNPSKTKNNCLISGFVTFFDGFWWFSEERETPQKTRITVDSKGFWRFLTVFDNPSKMGNNCII